MKKKLGNMEQLLTFLVTILLSAFFISIQSPLLFLLSFTLGVSYHVLRGKQKDWKLPNEIKKMHQW